MFLNQLFNKLFHELNQILDCEQTDLIFLRRKIKSEYFNNNRISHAAFIASLSGLSWKHWSLLNLCSTLQTCWAFGIWWKSVINVIMRNSNIGNIIQVRIVSICFSFKFYKSKQLGKGTWYIYYHFSCLKNSSCQLSATS